MTYIKYSNHLTFIDTICAYREFLYLSCFKTIPEVLNKLKSYKNDIIFPTESETELLIQYSKLNDSTSKMNLLSTLIRRKSDTFNKKDYRIIQLTNNTKWYIRPPDINLEINELNKNIDKLLSLPTHDNKTHDIAIYKTPQIRFIDIKDRLDIFNTFIYNCKHVNNIDTYVQTCLNNLKFSSEFHLQISSYKRDKINKLIFNKLSPFTLFIVMLQPYSFCDNQFLFYGIYSTFEFPKCSSYNQHQLKDHTINKRHTSTSDIMYKISQNYISSNINKDYNNLKLEDILKEYDKTFFNDERLCYKMIWIAVLSYFIEYVLYISDNTHYDILISYIKLLGIKQYQKGDLYKKKIERIFNFLNEDKTLRLQIPNLFKYCQYIILDDEINAFLMDLYSDSDVDSSTTQIVEEHLI